ncbi:cation:proton antiporter [Peptostreptococcus equinus]|uniref:Cation:proton antiporter n=1 Tax=Peptostreptococcus equinus TaxID=3003601 RepID=A0ABY7JQT0_9FIRM|nr:cation:proton antiporter [Peptostreptococcus sp. CBA3647]WAW14866.1 cation:proton antiporter [Peptostreptococcus sp. CBA3647]
MLTSLAVILLLGMFLGGIFDKLRLPSLVGMIIAGIIVGPHGLNLLSKPLIDVSGDLRQFALIIILTRAGLSLDVEDLLKAGRPAVLLCFLPACAEILGVVVLAPPIFGISVVEAAIMGAVIAAVSPAVVVPRMLKLLEEGYGKEHRIPQMILAGSSMDDIFVIVMFTAFISLEVSGSVSASSFAQIPISIGTGIAIGILVGIIINRFYSELKLRNTVELIVMLCVSFLLLELEHVASKVVPISALLAIMSMGMVINRKNPNLASKLANKYNKIWVGADVMLFVLVGATVDMKYVMASGGLACILVVGALLFRMVGVLLCLVKTKVRKNERAFCMLAYTPKATVQAAIGAIPLSMGLPCGQVVLTVAVVSILLTAPFGAFIIDKTYKKLLTRT